MVGTLMEHVEMVREKKQLEEISDWELRLLANGIRIDIPLKSATHMHRVGVVLVEYGEAMQRVSKRKDQTSFQILDTCWSMGRIVRRRIAEICNIAKHD